MTRISIFAFQSLQSRVFQYAFVLLVFNREQTRSSIDSCGRARVLRRNGGFTVDPFPGEQSTFILALSPWRLRKEGNEYCNY